MSLNGLDMLASARDKRRQNRQPARQGSARTVPPPRHAPKPPAVVAEVKEKRPVEVASPKQKKETAAQSVVAPAAPDAELRRVTVYLESEAADWLDAVLVAGKQMKPRVNSASAVIRLAISQLAEQTSPAEVASILRKKALEQGPQQGRKRV